MAKKFDKDKAQSMLKEIESLKQDAYDAYLLKRDEHMENLAFYLGYQHTVMNAQFIDDGAGEALEQRNIIRPIIRAATSTLLKQRINPEVPAVHGDQKARAKADCTEMLCKSFLNTGIFDYDEIRSCIDWSRICGLAWVKVCWNVDGGKLLESPPIDPELAEKNEFGEDIVEQYAEGEISLEFVPTTDLLVDPTIKSKKELRERSGAYVVHRRLLPVRVLEDKFPMDMFGEETKGKFRAGTRMGQNDFTPVDDEFMRTINKASEGNVLGELCEFWENPSRKYPKGRLAIFSGQVIIYIGPNLYTPTRIPFIPLKGDNNIPGALYSAGAIADLKAMQRTINRVSAKQREWLDSILHSRIWAPIGSGVDPDSLINISGQIVEYNKGYMPEVDRPPDIPQSMFTYVEELSQAAKKVSGYDDVAQGSVPPNLSTGRAIAFARENNEQMRVTEQMEYTSFCLAVLQQMLYTAKQFYQEGRLIKVTGDEGKWTLKALNTEDFDFGNDIVIEVFSGGPNSHALRFSETLELFQAGLLTDDPAAKAARTILADDAVNKVSFDKSPEARNKAKRHILTVLKTPEEEIFVNAWDEHAEYLDVVNRWRQTVEYEELDPYRKKLIDTACEQAEYFLQQQTAQMGQDAATLQGGGLPPTEGAPPPAPPGLESPPDGGNSTYAEPQEESQSELVARETGESVEGQVAGG